MLDTRELTDLLALSAWVADPIHAIGVYDRDLTDVYYNTGEERRTTCPRFFSKNVSAQCYALNTTVIES